MIYLVIETRFYLGEDTEREVVGYSYEYDKAESHALALTARHEQKIQKRKFFIDETLANWEKENPRPDYVLADDLKLPEIPKWVSVPGIKQVITVEQRAERDKIVQIRNEALEKANKPVREWIDARGMLYAKNDMLAIEHSDMTTWTVEEVKELK